MENVDISIFLSIIAILGSIFTYFKHDRKIKAQEKRINAYNIDKIEQEKIQNKQAIIRASVIKGSKGHRTLRVCNKGKATAYNIRLDIANEPKYLYSNNPFPFKKLNEHDSVDLNIHLHTGSPDSLDITLIWDDDFAKDNTHNQIVQLF